MKCSLPLSILLFVALFTTGNGEKRRSTNLNDFHSTNSAEERPDNSTSDNAGRLTSTWIWLPNKNERNKIKYEPIIGFLEDSKEFGVDKVGNEKRDHNASLHSSNLTVVAGEKLLKEGYRGKKQRIVERRYLTFQKRLQRKNWCFKKKQVSAYHKFKKTDACCQTRKLCRTTKHVKRGLYECSCDVHFYRCLENARTKISARIGELYFNRHTVVCYKKQLVQPCTKLPCDHVYYKQKNVNYFPK